MNSPGDKTSWRQRRTAVLSFDHPAANRLRCIASIVGGVMQFTAKKHRLTAVLLAVGLAGTATACGGGGGSDGAAQATGQITVWMSNNAEEVA